MLLAAFAIAMLAQPAMAQLNTGYSPVGRRLYGPGWSPNLSPYLNLLRGGNVAANYFIGVRPEIQRRQNAALFGIAIDELDRRTSGGPEEYAPTPPVSSGTYVYLANTGPYFNNTGGFFPTAGRPANSLMGQQPPSKSGRRGPSSGPAPGGSGMPPR
jgi:hypothetical protein